MTIASQASFWLLSSAPGTPIHVSTNVAKKLSCFLLVNPRGEHTDFNRNVIIKAFADKWEEIECQGAQMPCLDAANVCAVIHRLQNALFANMAEPVPYVSEQDINFRTEIWSTPRPLG